MKHLLCCSVTRPLSHFSTAGRTPGAAGCPSWGHPPPLTLESSAVFSFHQREPRSRRSRPLR